MGAQMGGQGVKEVLQGLISLGPVLANLIIVIGAVTGVSYAGYAATRIYHAVQNGDHHVLNWIVAFIIACAMTISAIIIGAVSLFYTDM